MESLELWPQLWNVRICIRVQWTFLEIVYNNCFEFHHDRVSTKTATHYFPITMGQRLLLSLFEFFFLHPSTKKTMLIRLIFLLQVFFWKYGANTFKLYWIKFMFTKCLFFTKRYDCELLFKKKKNPDKKKW